MENYINRRQRICNSCPIHSKKPKEGFIKGCGCRLDWKIKNINSKCIAGLW